MTADPWILRRPLQLLLLLLLLPCPLLPHARAGSRLVLLSQPMQESLLAARRASAAAEPLHSPA